MKKRLATPSAFTLFEVILALMILGILSGAIYTITSAALESTKTTLVEQTSIRRLEAFARITRDAFLNLPADGKLFLRMGKSAAGAPAPELVFSATSGAFGISSLGGGSLILSAKPQSDGTRTFSILRIPRDVQGIEYDRLIQDGGWIHLLPGVERVQWSFWHQDEWMQEWPEGSERPALVRLCFEYVDLPGRLIDLQFWIPPLAPPQAPPPFQNPSPTPQPSPDAP